MISKKHAIGSSNPFTQAGTNSSHAKDLVNGQEKQSQSLIKLNDYIRKRS
ncbi:YpzG family protein [Peribacillus alkalitolerans]|nr:YpzG family protein [Peribacillus alkalitolerans]